MSSAERRVHAAISHLTDVPGVCLHSLNLPEHDYKICAELDFVLVLKDVILVVEVKGGGVSCRSGIWSYSNRYGAENTSTEGPFQQARSGMFALRDRLGKQLGVRYRGLPFGFLVITPDCDLLATVEYDEATYLSGTQLRRPDGLLRALGDCVRFWEQRQPRRRGLVPEQRREVLNVLRPDFDRVPALATRLDDLDARFERLTDEQMTRLDLLDDNDRVLISGGAGTGKTFLAAETARRAGASGLQTLVVCRSDVLAVFLSSRVRSRMSRALFFAQLSTVESASVDLLVVDEGQDLLFLDAMEQMDRVLRGGVAQGRWRFFHDSNNQAAVYDDQEPDALALLTEVGPARATLSRNCRNTRGVAFQTRLLTGADLGVTAAGVGLPVEFVDVADAASESQALGRHLRGLREQGVPERDVLLISLRGNWSTSSAAALPQARQGGIQRLNAPMAAAWPLTAMTWAGVEQVKGLESRFVCVIDMTGLVTPQQVSGVYVALSRARSGLWVAVPTSAAQDVRAAAHRHRDIAMQMMSSAGAGID